MLINLCSWSKTLAGPWIIAAAVVSAQVPMDNDELSRHLTTVRSQIENTSLNLPRREELALEMAGTLDRAAQSSANPEERRRHWSEAIELLDWFLKQNPDPPRERLIRFQAGVYRWAQARSWTDASLLVPTDPLPRNEGIQALDNALERFRAVAGEGNSPTLADNLRFRLAEALADRADLDPATSSDRRTREREALEPAESASDGSGSCGLLVFAQSRSAAASGETGRGRKRTRRCDQVDPSATAA